MKRITIIGGGLAGLTLGIALRQREVPVRILEAGDYPRHRVCGEFISGHGLAVLERLGLISVLKSAGAVRANTAAFFTSGRSCGVQVLPSAAWCLARWRLDAGLARFYLDSGGVLETGTRANPAPREGTVLANGRRRARDESFRWFGLKAHAQEVELDADLEMHVARDSYVGLCRLGDGTVNVCGLFRRGGDRKQSSGVVEELRGLPGTRLFQRLRHARFVPESVCAVAGLALAPEPIDPRECRVGDALTMIPPITGNGMSIAFESAELAGAPLADYARGAHSWEHATTLIATRLRQSFRRRLMCAAALHRLLFNDAARAAVLPLAFRSRVLWRLIFAMTRTAPRRGRSEQMADGYTKRAGTNPAQW